MPFFGFIPSTELLQTIQTAQQKKDSSEPLYPLRDKTALLINDEIIDAILTELVRCFPPSDKRDTAEKLAGYIKSTVAVLLKQLLGKSSNDVVQASIQFSDKSLFKDVEVQIYSHLLRSNCPVTGQPDWGTVFIRYKGKKPCYNSILAYIISYRQHNGFHEQCVEQIFADIWQNLKPEKLMVYAAYTRRGGLDINPCRVSDVSWMPRPIRLARQ